MTDWRKWLANHFIRLAIRADVGTVLGFVAGVNKEFIVEEVTP